MTALGKPFLILQLRPETEAADGEFQAFLDKGDLDQDEVTRIRLDQQSLPNDLDLADYAGVIVGGGPGCVSDPEESKPVSEKQIETAILGLMPAITANDVPFMGCCYGIGILAHHLGAEVSKKKYSEPVGPSHCQLTEEGARDPLLSGLPSSFDAFVGHKEAVQVLPKGCVQLMSSMPCPFQMIRFGKNVYATQFHPEADGAEFETRINIYRDRGYFPPQDADRLIADCQAANVVEPQKILKRFVARYRET